MKMVEGLAQDIGTMAACSVLSVPRASIYRWRKRNLNGKKKKSQRSPPLALSETERQEVKDVLHDPKFVDMAPHQVYASLLDVDRYLCSIRTMYRILEKEGEVRERRNQRRHPTYQRPELLATGVNQLWSWDITYLKGPKKGNHYKLYVVLDVYSRYVVAWTVAKRENADLAARMIGEACRKQSIEADQLTIHADNGRAMISKPVSYLMADLGITKTHSRPSVSNDNPYSEAQFKTLKYRPDFPSRFSSIEEARRHCREFFNWYNTQHHHTGIALLTPHQVHYGEAETILAKRNRSLAAVHENNLRFKGKKPKFFKLPPAVWINPPEGQTQIEKC